MQKEAPDGEWNDIKNALDLNFHVSTFIKAQHRKDKGGFYKQVCHDLVSQKKEKRNRHLEIGVKISRHTQGGFLSESGLKFPLIDVIKRA